MKRILVTSAGGANGDGYGTLLCFSASGELAGPFSNDPRINDPRGLSLSPAGDLIYVISGDDRVLALGQNGDVTLDSGRKEAWTPAAVHSHRTAATALPCGAAARSWPCHPGSSPKANRSCPTAPSRSRSVHRS